MDHRKIATMLLAGVFAGMCTGCEERTVLTGGGPSDVPPTETGQPGDVPSGGGAVPSVLLHPPLSKVDILVMVDRSPTMEDEHRTLAEHFASFIEELLEPTDPRFFPLTDLRIGVVSQDLGSNGVVLPSCEHGVWSYDGGDRGCLLRGAPGTTCPGMEDRSWLERNEATPWYTPEEMADDFACIARQGPYGCGIEQQFASVLMALTERLEPGECNEGFLRRDSVLGIVIITDEEECSVADPRIFDRSASELHPEMNLRCYFDQHVLIPTETIVGRLSALRGPDAPPPVVVMLVGVPDVPECQARGDAIGGCLGLPEMRYAESSVVPGMVMPACTRRLPGGAFSEASPGRRFVEIAQGLGRRALVSSICPANWWPTMQAMLELVQDAARVCFPRALELDPATCATDCRVVQVLAGVGQCPPGTAPDPDRPTEAIGGSERRRCIIPQAHREPWGDGSCGLPQTSGWYYVPAEHSGFEGCNMVLVTDDIPIEPGSVRKVECPRWQ